MRLLSTSVIVAALALTACSTGAGARGCLSAQDVQSLMDRDAISEIFAGHSGITIRLDTGEFYNAVLPPVDVVEEYLERREAIGRPVLYEME